MTETLVERVWAWLHETFPERQIYIRSDGRVQFFTFGPTLQASLAGLSLIFLGWVAFATVNVIFKDRIIAAKDHRYQQMQSAYENRVADLQLSYDEVNGALVSAEDKFKSTADELQVKQSTIMQFLDRKQQVDATLMNSGSQGVGVRPGTTNPEGGAASDSLGTAAPPAGIGGSDADDGGSSELTVSPQPVKPQPRTGKPNSCQLSRSGRRGGTNCRGDFRCAPRTNHSGRNFRTPPDPAKACRADRAGPPPGANRNGLDEPNAGPSR